MTTTLDYKLIIRNADNSADDFYFSTILGDSCFTLAAPKGDGQSNDFIKGTFTIGNYTYRIIDAGAGPLTPSDGAVSSKMADAAGRYRLIARVALVLFSTDRGMSWENYVTGFVTRIQKSSALVYEFTIGDAQRVDKKVTLFKEKSAQFDKMSCLLGGPVVGGFGPIRDYGPWIMRTKGHYASIAVQFHFLSGYVRRSAETLFMNFPTGGFMSVEGDYTSYEERKVNALADPYRVGTPDYKAAGIGSHYPRLECRVEDMSGTLIGVFKVLNGRDPAYTLGGGWSAGDMHAILSGGDLCLDWKTSGINPNTGVAYPTQPTTDTHLRMVVYALDVTDVTPVHVDGKPVELCAKAYLEAGIPYDSASVASCTADIGDAYRIALRPTKSMSVESFVSALSGLFGFTVRQQGGVRYFYSTRIRVSSVPTITLGADDLSNARGVIFDQDEKSIINKVTVVMEHYDLWAPEKFGKDTTRPVDELVTTQRTVSVVPPATDAAELTVHEQTYTIQGELYALQIPKFLIMGPTLALLGATTAVELSEQDFVMSIASGAGSILDRRQRGAIVGALNVLRGTAAAGAQLGEEMYCVVPWQQNKNGVGGNRIVQVTKRTENPAGPSFSVEDSGTAAQPATLPTFTAAKDSTTDPKRYVLITITNASALIAEGDSVRIEWGAGASPTSYQLLVQLTPAQLTAGRTIIRMPRLDAGITVSLRMRSELEGIRPSTYTSPATVVLDSLVAPSALSIIGQAGDDTQAVVSWTIGETDIPIEVRFRVVGDTAWRTVIAAAGSANILVGTLALLTTYDFDVRHHEKPQWNGVSASVTASFTTGSVERTLLAPDNPSAFSGSFDATTGAFVNDGTYGLEVTAVEFPESIAFEVAIETSVGAGTYGSYVEPPFGVRSGVQYPSRTRFTALAPGDGLRRQMRAKAVRVGAIDSPYCAEVSVLPFVPQQPTDYPVAVPVLDLSYQVIEDAGAQRAVIVAHWTQPTESQYEDMEYLVRSRVTGSSTWSTYSRVPGTKQGPDLIGAQFGGEFEVTLVTITHQGVRNEGIAPDGIKVIDIPAAAADGVVTAVADSDSMNITIVPNVIAAAYDLFSVPYASDPGTVDRVDADPLNYRAPRRAATETYLELPVDASTMNWRVATIVFYDQNGIEGDYQTVKVQQNPAASPPSAPTLSNQSLVANALVERVTFVTTPTALDEILFYRGGTLYITHSITSGEITAGYADITDTGAAGGSTYVYAAKQHRQSDGLYSAFSSNDSETAAAGGTLATPDAPSCGMDSGDPCASMLVTPRDTSGNPSGTTYSVYTATTSGGTYTLQASGVAKNVAVSVTRPSGQHGTSYAKIEAHRSGYTTSGKSSAGSIGPVPSGTLC